MPKILILFLTLLFPYMTALLEYTLTNLITLIEFLIVLLEHTHMIQKLGLIIMSTRLF